MNYRNKIIQGNCLETLKLLPDGIADTCITSPPYYGLRDYGTGDWVGGDPACDHKGAPFRTKENIGGDDVKNKEATQPFKNICGKCGAQRVDDQLGLEKTPEEFIGAMVKVFREVWRVLKPAGTCWINIGDSYVGTGTGTGDQKSSTLGGGKQTQIEAGKRPHKRPGNGLKRKDLIGIPWRLAFALQQPFYTGRIKNEQDRIWLAAMMDGEGTFSGFYHERKDGGIRTGVNVCLTNSCMLVLNRAAEIWPASLHAHEQHNKRLGTKPVFRWKPAGAENVGDFCAELYPYLMTKRRQAMLCWNIMQFAKDGQKWGKSIDAQAVREKRNILVKLISQINKGGNPTIPDWVKEPPILTEPGFYLRQDIIWEKPAPMPESVGDRCTKSHEYIFLLSKSATYYYDAEAIKEPVSDKTHERYARGRSAEHKWSDGNTIEKAHSFHKGKVNDRTARKMAQAGSGIKNNTSFDEAMAVMPIMCNKRSVWTVATEAFPEAHFATYPQALIVDCIKAGSSEHGCCAVCGAPYERIVEPSARYAAVLGIGYHDHEEDGSRGITQTNGSNIQNKMRDAGIECAEYETKGWQKTCECSGNEIQPAVILDPFMGAGTTGLVARKNYRDFIGTELNPEYIAMATKRLKKDLGMFL